MLSLVIKTRISSIWSAIGTKNVKFLTTGMDFKREILPRCMIGWEECRKSTVYLPFTGINTHITTDHSLDKDVIGDNHLRNEQQNRYFCLNLRQIKKRKMNKHKRKKRIKGLRNNIKARKSVRILRNLIRSRDMARKIVSYGTCTTAPIRAIDR